MSLINEALKKAQRLRHEPRSDAPAGDASTTSSPARRPGSAPRMQVIVIAGAAGIVLVVLSVVLTAILLNRDDGPAEVPVVIATPPPEPLVETAEPSPVIVAPVIAATNAPTKDEPATNLASRETSSVAITLPSTFGSENTAPAAAETATSETGPTSTASTSLPPPTALPAIAPSPDMRIQEFVDAIRVAGIRSSGNESRVLMNDRVYRVNDVVDRSLGLRLIKVASDSLTFADPNGVTYTKVF